MERDFREALKNRRSCYALTADSPLSPADVEALCGFVLDNVPSAFNSQSTRLVSLGGAAHRALWALTLEALRPLVPADKFGGTEKKIASFAAGAGTILFFEDRAVVAKLQADFPLYKDNFPVWSQHANAMHQLALWTLLEDAGAGASLQHYNPLIDAEVARTWSLDPAWALVAQMPHGGVAARPPAPAKLPLAGRLKETSKNCVFCGLDQFGSLTDILQLLKPPKVIKYPTGAELIQRRENANF